MKFIFVLLLLMVVPQVFAAEKTPVLGPPDKVEALQGFLEEKFTFIIRGSSALLTKARALAQRHGARSSIRELGFIGAISAEIPVKDALVLSKDPQAVQVWYVHPDLLPEYVTIIQGIGYAIENIAPPSVLNLSVGPRRDSMPIPAFDEEPMNQATKVAADRGFLAIFATGNYFNGSNPGVINPWCRPRWVMCVGAATADAKSVWSDSARGSPDDARSWPTVVANGVDVIGPWPTYLTKSKERRQLDESNARFIAQVPKEQRELFTLASGTSQAAPQVTRAAAQVMHFLSNVLAERKDLKAKTPLFSLEFDVERLARLNRLGARETGLVTRQASGTIEINYYVDQPWKLVKQILIDTAIPMPDFQPHEVGAGFVSPEFIEKQFGKYGKADIGIMPVKVTNQ